MTTSYEVRAEIEDLIERDLLARGADPKRSCRGQLARAALPAGRTRPSHAAVRPLQPPGWPSRSGGDRRQGSRLDRSPHVAWSTRITKT